MEPESVTSLLLSKFYAFRNLGACTWCALDQAKHLATGQMGLHPAVSGCEKFDGNRKCANQVGKILAEMS